MKIDIMEYFEKEKDHRIGLGCHKYAPLILILNDKEKIVSELLEESDCYYKENLLIFLDQAHFDCMRANKYGDQVYEDIRWILNSYVEMKKQYEKPEKISLEEFEKYLKGC